MSSFRQEGIPFEELSFFLVMHILLFSSSMSSHAGHVTMEIVYRQMLALWLGNGNEHHPLESDTTGLNVKGNLYLTLYGGGGLQVRF